MKHVYHFCASYQWDMATHLVDGILTRELPITEGKHYIEVKQGIKEYFDIPVRSENITVKSLTKLGEAE